MTALASAPWCTQSPRWGQTLIRLCEEGRDDIGMGLMLEKRRSEWTCWARERGGRHDKKGQETLVGQEWEVGRGRERDDVGQGMGQGHCCALSR